MSTLISSIETSVREALEEPTANFWTSAELIGIINRGVKDLWRATVDLKQEHYISVNNTDVTLPANSSTLSGLPSDIHKVYIIEARDQSTNSTNNSLIFIPLDYNDIRFQNSRGADAVDASSNTIYYAITGQGGPVNAPTIYCAPQVTSSVNISFVYVPTLQTLTAGSIVPIPGEADNALIAWTIAFARAKERDDRSPDPNYLAVYSTEKMNILQSLGLRQYQEPSYVSAAFEEYW